MLILDDPEPFERNLETQILEKAKWVITLTVHESYVFYLACWWFGFNKLQNKVRLSLSVQVKFSSFWAAPAWFDTAFKPNLKCLLNSMWHWGMETVMLLSAQDFEVRFQTVAEQSMFTYKNTLLPWQC